MRTKRIGWLLAIVFVSLLPVSALADPVTVENWSFERNTSDFNLQDDVAMRNSELHFYSWVSSSDNIAGALNPGVGYFIYAPAPDGTISTPAPDGDYVGYLKYTGTLSQTLEYTLLPDTKLTLEFDLGWIRQEASFIAPQVSVSLSTGDQLLASLTNTADNQLGLTSGYFSHYSFSYLVQDTDSFGSPLTITIANNTIYNDAGKRLSGQAIFDDFHLSNDSAAVPEPGSLLLLGAGLLGLGLFRKVRKI